MSEEENIELFRRQVEALEKIANSLSCTGRAKESKPAASKAEAKPKTQPKPKQVEEKEKEEGPPLEQVRAALLKVAKKISSARARELLEDYGSADTIRKLSKDKYAAVLEAAETELE